MKMSVRSNNKSVHDDLEAYHYGILLLGDWRFRRLGSQNPITLQIYLYSLFFLYVVVVFVYIIRTQ